MRTWEAGSKPRGFTLLELLVVVAIIALASAGVVTAMRDPVQSQLEREAQRLSALLDSARALSRASGVVVRWTPTTEGFMFDGLPPNSLPQRWLMDGIVVNSAGPVLLGPEPIIEPQAIVLSLADHPAAILHLVTDGLAPFSVQADAPAR